eukprot:COSAG02_NODE_31720_length_528_cov_1.419580_1_plen_22_part_10
MKPTWNKKEIETRPWGTYEVLL